jgi:hypothetical protein
MNIQRRQFVQRLYQLLLFRTPTSAELLAGATQVFLDGPGALAYDLVMGQEYRTRVVTLDVNPLLRRTDPPTATEVDALLSTGLDLLRLRVRMLASQEFYDRGY